jgi:hypothetical protein
MKKQKAPEITQEQLDKISQNIKPILDKKLEKAKEIIAKIKGQTNTSVQ